MIGARLLKGARVAIGAADNGCSDGVVEGAAVGNKDGITVATIDGFTESDTESCGGFKDGCGDGAANAGDLSPSAWVKGASAGDNTLLVGDATGLANGVVLKSDKLLEEYAKTPIVSF